MKDYFKYVMHFGVVALLASSCQETELIEKTSPFVKVETIDGSTDPQFMKLIEPFTGKSISGRILQQEDYQRVKKLTGDDYVNYTLPIPTLNDTKFAAQSLILSIRNDTARYNLLEIIPDINWNGNFEQFTGKISTYLIEFNPNEGNSSGRSMTKTPNDDCMRFVIDNVVVHADLSATAYGHWVPTGNCGSGSSNWSDHYWMPNWNTESPGEWTGGDPTGSHGGGSDGSGSGGGHGGNQHVPISVEEMFAAQVLEVLEVDPTALIDVNCEELSQKWASLAQHKPNQAVLDRIALLNQNGYDIEVQYIEEAAGPVVNMDYFPVQITTLPLSPATGNRFTASEFLNYIRTNFAQFCSSANSSFGPYNQTEGQRWNTSNYLGTVMRFDISVSLFGIDGQQDGSVICTNQQGQSWIFSTIYTSQDHSHPVSGNREFGLVSNPDGTYTFFTKGVDRIAEMADIGIGVIVGYGAFEGGEDLWSSLQDNLTNFINNPENGGTAAKINPTIKRIDIAKLQDVLDGTQPVSVLGCN